MESLFSFKNDTNELIASNVISGLIKDDLFTDVTLACADDALIQAHKVILGAYSSVFRNILMKITSKNPVIYLKGVDYEEMVRIIEYIYLGETKISQSNLASFMKMAQEFHLKGLASEDVLQLNSNTELVKKKANNAIEDNQNVSDDPLNSDKADHKVIQESVTSVFKLPSVKSESLIEDGENNQSSTENQCPYCLKSIADKSNMKRHIKLVHEFVKYPCDLCDFKTKSSKTLKYHKGMKHDDSQALGDLVIPTCSICDKMFSDKSNMLKHIRSAHESLTYPCNFCTFNTRSSKKIKLHITEVHNIELKNGGDE